MLIFSLKCKLNFKKYIKLINNIPYYNLQKFIPYIQLRYFITKIFEHSWTFLNIRVQDRSWMFRIVRECSWSFVIVRECSWSFVIVQSIFFNLIIFMSIYFCKHSNSNIEIMKIYYVPLEFCLWYIYSTLINLIK